MDLCFLRYAAQSASSSTHPFLGPACLDSLSLVHDPSPLKPYFGASHCTSRVHLYSVPFAFLMCPLFFTHTSFTNLPHTHAHTHTYTHTQSHTHTFPLHSTHTHTHTHTRTHARTHTYIHTYHSPLCQLTSLTPFRLIPVYPAPLCVHSLSNISPLPLDNSSLICYGDPSNTHTSPLHNTHSPLSSSGSAHTAPTPTLLRLKSASASKPCKD